MMTDSEVPQGKQEGPGKAHTASDSRQSDSGYADNLTELVATPEHQLKPQLVWLGRFLGMDIYMDIHSINGKSKHAELARRVFKAKLGEMN